MRKMALEEQFSCWLDMMHGVRGLLDQKAALADQLHAGPCCVPLQRKIHGYELRPIVVLRKRRMSAVMYAWWVLSTLSWGPWETHIRWEQTATCVGWQPIGHYLSCRGPPPEQAVACVLVLVRRYLQAEERRRRRLRFERAVKFFANQQYTKAWNSWWVRCLIAHGCLLGYHEEVQHERACPGDV